MQTLNKKIAAAAIVLTGCTDNFDYKPLLDEQMDIIQSEHLMMLKKTEPLMLVMAEKAVEAGSLPSDRQRGSGDAVKDLQTAYVNLYDVIGRGAVYAFNESTIAEAGYEAGAAWQIDENGQYYMLVKSDNMNLEPGDVYVPINTYLHEAGHIFGGHGNELVKINQAHQETGVSPNPEEYVHVIEKDKDFAEILGNISWPVYLVSATWSSQVALCKDIAARDVENTESPDKVIGLEGLHEGMSTLSEHVFNWTHDEDLDSYLKLYGLSAAEYRDAIEELGIIDQIKADCDAAYHQEYERIQVEIAETEMAPPPEEKPQIRPPRRMMR